MSANRSRARVAAAVAAALLVGAFTAWVTRAEPPAPASDTAPGQAATVPMPSPDGPERPSPSSGPSGESTGMTGAHDATLGSGPAALAAPSRFEIARLGIDMKVLPVGVAKDGQMALPRTPADIGWYEYGPRPGDSVGATVLAGHLDMPGYGTGPLGRLDELRKGDIVTLRSGTTVRRYRVDEVLALKKATLDLASLFSRDGPARLHIVTCGGRFDPVARKYDENIVAVATPVA